MSKLNVPRRSLMIGGAALALAPAAAFASSSHRACRASLHPRPRRNATAGS